MSLLHHMLRGEAPHCITSTHAGPALWVWRVAACGAFATLVYFALAAKLY